VFILRMRNVPMIDSSGVAALSDFMRRCRARGVAVIVSGIRPQPSEVLARMGFDGRHDNLRLAENFAAARAMAAAMIQAGQAE
jgi:SulP family sulfate permease